MFYRVTLSDVNETGRSFVFEERNPETAQLVAQDLAQGMELELREVAPLELGDVIMELCMY